MERLPDSILNGKFLHCRPVDGGPIITAPIIPTEGETPLSRVVIICEARDSRSRCRLRREAGSKDDHCLYYKGDSKGDYQIIGPGMDRKYVGGWE